MSSSWHKAMSPEHSKKSSLRDVVKKCGVLIEDLLFFITDFQPSLLHLVNIIIPKILLINASSKINDLQKMEQLSLDIL